MPSTHISLHYHLVFSTKYRIPYIGIMWSARLHEYLGGIVRRLDGFPEGVGGWFDHVHLLVGLKATHCLADVMRALKYGSTLWIRREIGIREFAWQRGYAAFSVSESRRAVVRRYIANQERHHRKHSYRDELVDMLGRSGAMYDPRYLD